MAHIVDLLSVEELGSRYRASTDARLAHHYQAICLLAQGRRLSDVAATIGFVPRWLEELAQRCNQFGPDALADRRCHNGTRARLLMPELLDRLCRRLKMPPSDGRTWTTTQIAAWMAGELGVVSVYPQRAWDALQAIG